MFQRRVMWFKVTTSTVEPHVSFRTCSADDNEDSGNTQILEFPSTISKDYITWLQIVNQAVKLSVRRDLSVAFQAALGILRKALTIT